VRCRLLVGDRLAHLVCQGLGVGQFEISLGHQSAILSNPASAVETGSPPRKEPSSERRGVVVSAGAERLPRRCPWPSRCAPGLAVPALRAVGCHPPARALCREDRGGEHALAGWVSVGALAVSASRFTR
jgi:hypothetical protein